MVFLLWCVWEELNGNYTKIVKQGPIIFLTRDTSFFVVLERDVVIFYNPYCSLFNASFSKLMEVARQFLTKGNRILTVPPPSPNCTVKAHPFSFLHRGCVFLCMCVCMHLAFAGFARQFSIVPVNVADGNFDVFYKQNTLLILL